MQLFVERADGTRQKITQIQMDILKRRHGYRQIIATNAMCVVKNLALKSTLRPEKNYKLGGGRLRNPYEHLGV